MVIFTYPLWVRVYLIVIAGVFGLIMGSALHCLAYRMSRDQKWSGSSRSLCPHCGHTLGIFDLIPLFSWLFLKGKCRYCGEKISWRYPASEALLALVFITVVAKFGMTIQCLSALVLCGCLFCLSLVDLEIQIIPDRFLVIPAVTQLTWLFIDGQLWGVAYGLVHALALGGSVLVLSLIMDKLLHKDTMGGGDIKLLAVLGLFFGLEECLLLVLIACVAGILIALLLQKAKPDTPFPFGPALALAAWVTLIFGHKIVHWYLGLF